MQQLVKLQQRSNCLPENGLTKVSCRTILRRSLARRQASRAFDLSSARLSVIKRFSVWGSNEIQKSEKHTIVYLLGRCTVCCKFGQVCVFSFQVLAAKILLSFRFFHSVFRFCSPKHAANMKIAAFALLVAGVASESVSTLSNEKSSLKERSNLKDATVGEVAAALKLLARKRPHQSFLQNEFEQVLGQKTS